MKVARFVLKCVALGLTVATAACLLIAYWDKLMDFFYNLADRVEERKSAHFCDDEFEITLTATCEQSIKFPRPNGRGNFHFFRHLRMRMAVITITAAMSSSTGQYLPA